MQKSQNSRLAPIFVLLSLPLLAGCGGSGSKQTGEKIFKGIYTTGVDCADSGKLSYEDCATAMAQAVTKHEKEAPTYDELRFCEAKQGAGKCEFTANHKYRPKLLAFLVTASKPPTALPLYAHQKAKEGFHDSAGKDHMYSDDQLVFSEHAQTMFEQNGKKKKSR